MKIAALITVLFWTALAMAIGAFPVRAADNPNILIFGEDTDRDTVPRDSRVFLRVLNALSNELHDQGFDVFDETAITLENFTQGRRRRSDAEIIDISRSLKKPPIDVAVLFSIYASAKQLAYTTLIRTRIEGRLINVRNGQRLGNFEVERPGDNAPHQCNRECLLQTVGRQSKHLAQDLGAALTTKLAHLTDGGGNRSPSAGNNLATGYTLNFNGFSVKDITGIEEFMVAFSGYKSHRPIRSSNRHAEYWYETTSTNARLNRNIRRMLDHIGAKGVVSFAGATIDIRKVSLRKER